MIKKLLLGSLLLFSELQGQVIIDPAIFAQNAWLYNKSLAATHVDFAPDLIDAMPAVAQSGVKYMRIGGRDASFFPLVHFDDLSLLIDDADQLKTLIDLIRDWGMEPIVTVSCNPTSCAIHPDDVEQFGILTPGQQAEVAGNLVHFLNNSIDGIYKDDKILYWIIGNEPDLGVVCSDPAGYGYNSTSHSATIAAYMKDFAQKMKEKDPNIKIIGPEFATFGNDSNFSMNDLMEELLGTGTNSIMGTIPTGPAAGLFYIDIVSFHQYVMPTSPGTNLTLNPSSDNDGFLHLLRSSSAPNKKSLLEMVPTTRTIDNLKFACTEFNVDMPNTYDESSSTGYTDMVNGTDSRSFAAGQWMAEVFSYALGTSGTNSGGQEECWVQFMAPWSVTEGDCAENLGYISNCAGYEGRKYSTYHHYSIVANNMRGKFYEGTTTDDLIKAFGSKSCPQISVIVMNQDNISKNIEISLNGTIPLTAGRPAQVFVTVDMGLHKYYADVCPPKSTTVYWFNGCGQISSKVYYDINKNLGSDPPETITIVPDVPVCLGCPEDILLRCAYTDTTGNFFDAETFLNSVTITDTAWFEGISRIPNGVTVTIKDAAVRFSAEAQIKVEPGGRLIVTDAHLHGCNDQEWEGIAIEGNNDTLHQLLMERSRVDNTPYPVNAKESNGIIIDQCFFTNGIDCITLEECAGFTITNSEITGFATAIKTSQTNPAPSKINNNYIANVDKGMSFITDNHSLLDINCNVLQYYSNYGIHSTSSIIKSQGSTLAGAGNVFNSYSQQTNHQIYHSGPPFIYHVDPSYPFTLTTSLSMNAVTVVATSDGCQNLHAPVLAPSASPLVPLASLFKIAPNPATSTAEITISPLKNNSLISVRDVSGRTIKEVLIPAETRNYQIDLSSWKNGIYFISLIENEIVLGKTKLVVAH